MTQAGKSESRSRPFVGVLVAAFTLLSITGSAAANGDLPKPVQAWYQALGDVDRKGLDSMLAEGARIELRDLGIVQTKGEFLDSLDAWAEANRDAEILTRPGKNTGDADAASVEVCYRFPSNEALFKETFRLEGEQIIESVQEQMAESCGEF